MAEQTETGINIANYIADRAAGTVSITKPVKASGNYVFVRSTYAVAIVNGAPTAVEGAPELKNINRQSIAAMRVMLDAEEARTNALRQQVDAMASDMDALDAA